MAKPVLKAYFKRYTLVWLPKSYDLILVIDDWLTKMVHYKPVKITLAAPRLVLIIPSKPNCD